MKSYNFLIFFSIVFTIYSAVNFYIFARGWQALPAGSAVRKIYLVLFIFVFLSFISGRILEKYHISVISDILVWTGSFWFAAILYFFFIVVFFDVLRTINASTPLYPSFATFNYERTKLIVFAISVLSVGGLLTYGYINAKSPEIKNLEYKISKNAGELKSLNIVMISDLHLGTIIENSRLSSIVEKVNSLNPDIILLAGDILDEDLGPVIRNNLGETLKNFNSKYGTFGITGNHEYIGGVEEACQYLAAHNVTMLRDSVIKIDNAFYLAGREDKDISTFTGKKRKSVDALLKEIDKSLPVILINHQPTEFDDAVKNEVDLHLSGHTHYGQLFPLNFVTNLVFELSHGYLRKGQTNFYVSNGVGTWGPPVRIGNSSEILNIRLNFGY
ncbi:MAG: metallophosphoesterase [Ignavibacteriae bacterium]|nr:metallophosphoesterase [Ignavibacteriota bacterium]